MIETNTIPVIELGKAFRLNLEGGVFDGAFFLTSLKVLPTYGGLELSMTAALTNFPHLGGDLVPDPITVEFIDEPEAE